MPLRLASVWLAVYGLAYMSTSLFPLTLPTYDPSQGHWAWRAWSGPAEIRYYGQVLFSMAAAAGLTLLAGVWYRGRRLSPQSELLWMLWAGTSMMMSLLYYVWHNWP